MKSLERLDESAISIVKVTDDGKWFVKKIEHGRWDIRETAAKILNFVPEVLVTVAGNSVSQVGVTIGKAGSADAFAASFNTGTAVARVAQATVDTAISGKVAALDNIGTVDVPVTATFTATTGNPTSGQIAITVVYQQRAENGAQVPTAFQN